MKTTHSNIAILLARLDSQRLPKKHFEKIGNEYLITHCLNRLKLGKNYSIVLATSDREIDTPLAVWAEENNIQVYRGDAHDLRKRISGCLEKFNADFFARVNADSPFIDSSLIEGGFDFLNKSDYDLYTNLYPRSFPYGYSVEVFNSGSFLKVMNQNPELENVTTYFYDHASDFKIKNSKYGDEDMSKVRLTLDTKEDLEFMKELYKKDEKLFSLPLEKIIQLIQNT